MKKHNFIIVFSIIGIAALAAGWFFFLAGPQESSLGESSDGKTENAGTALDAETAGKTYATLATNKGDIVLELFADAMPGTAGNFVKLAESGFYDGTRFHRVIDGFMLQGGDPLSRNPEAKDKWGTGGPGYTIEDEFVAGLSNTAGTVAMANTGAPDSGGSQFFINVADNTFLDFDKEPAASKHPVFGRVARGMDVVRAIAETPTDGRDRPLDDVVIERLTISSR